MNDQDLEMKLKAARVPEPSAEYWEDFPQRVMGRLRVARPKSEPRRAWRPRFAWALGIGFACLAIGFCIGHWSLRIEADSFALLQNEKVLREVFAMFPNRVRAIEQDEHGIRLVLSENTDVPSSTPLWIKICEGGKCRAVVTFSGQNLQIAGEMVEVLADAQGKVMLVGDRLFWSNAEETRMAANLRIQARPLAYTM
jgi:hypothetical protein